MLIDARPNKIIIVTGSTDCRKGIDGLAALVRLKYGQNPLEEGTLFLFCGRNRSRLKGLIYEEGGYCMITKRLSEGKFQWPRNSDEARTLTMEQFALLMRGFTLEGRITARG